ncbi:MAG: hypothetical protein HZA50_12320 [Planctomycetes bacterium]|nr:hypothetical protein [Planctomycetota bacterium]
MGLSGVSNSAVNYALRAINASVQQYADAVQSFSQGDIDIAQIVALKSAEQQHQAGAAVLRRVLDGESAFLDMLI